MLLRWLAEEKAEDRKPPTFGRLPKCSGVQASPWRSYKKTDLLTEFDEFEASHFLDCLVNFDLALVRNASTRQSNQQSGNVKSFIQFRTSGANNWVGSNGACCREPD
jgi:hypothetical protein